MESDFAEAARINVDYKRGLVSVKRTRVAEWSLTGDVGSLRIDSAIMQEVGIKVDSKTLHDAVAELLQD